MTKAQSAIAVECEVADDKPPSPSIVLAEPESAEEDLSVRLADLATAPQWNDWRWQMRNRIRSAEDLKRFFKDFEPSPGSMRAAERFPLAITPYYASLIRSFDESDPAFLMAVPQSQELIDPPFLKDDPLEEDHDTPVPGLVHRYPDRALVIATTTCAMYCRHCTRKRVAGVRESSLPAQRLARIAAYLRAHPEIHDVIVSGGDPFTLSTDALERILIALRSVPSVEVIRIGTRTPVTLPMRVTADLAAMLRKYLPIWVNTHFNHPNEITPDSAQACARLADAGIPLGNQSVLLRGVNDDPEIMERLCRGLIRMRVRPYYLFQCDLVRGVEHFRTPMSRGIEIMEYMRGRVSGLAIPTFVVDSPHGGGKLPVLPNYVVSTSPTHTVLRNFEGMLVSYPEPCVGDATTAVPATRSAAPGVWELASGLASKIQPADSARHKRRTPKAVISVLEPRSA
ncbi:KamA family radical SAM protein [Candidatus Sumerlaeota bacterium]|nr:KamA family radical SAM protein [Candidatus Sumerlaeota bacterium]